MAVSTSTSTLPLLFLHRSTTSPNPTALSFPSSLRASPLRSRAAAAAPAEALVDGLPSDTPPVGEGTGIPMPSSIGDDGEQLLFGATAGKETAPRACAQLHSSSDSFNVSQEKIVITNSYGEKLVGVLHEAGSKDIVVLCHGFRSSKESKTIMGLTDALTSEKISVFRFDFSGNGKSEVREEMWSSSMHPCIKMYLVSSTCLEDLIWSVELQIALAVIINQHGFIDVGRKKGHSIYRVTKESLMDRLKTDMQSACMSIDPNCRVLTVHGSDDATVPSEDAREFHKYISNHELHIIEGANHSYSSHQLELANTVLKFVRSG